ncbi:hypothetical protein [Sulfobacillus harzensis]|uniref:DUF2953 domain-containing protein n=1 Tax=Sulfobacillus harzensis TaxID=2729629 RepID=A0A7Y0L4C3_9FIRM|nr:hypothetical protein [Sulfobacillus harzensis]NMP22436.1 hypothetical protein [Sulfobacillus harzensis]
MDWTWAVIVAALAIVVIWAVSRPIRLVMAAEVDGLTSRLSIEVRYAYIHRQKEWNPPVWPQSSKHHNPKEPSFSLTPHLIDEAIWAFRVLNRITDQLWHRMRVERFDLCIRVGLGDAAATALWMGRLTDLAAWWIGLRIAPRAQSAPSWVVVPSFDEPLVAGEFTSIIRLQPSDIILAIVYGLLGQPKGGHTYGQSVQHHQQHA